MSHPNVVRLEAVHEDPRSIAIVMTLCRGGDLWDKVRRFALCKGAHGRNHAKATTCSRSALFLNCFRVDLLYLVVSSMLELLESHRRRFTACVPIAAARGR